MSGRANGVCVSKRASQRVTGWVCVCVCVWCVCVCVVCVCVVFVCVCWAHVCVRAWVHGCVRE